MKGLFVRSTFATVGVQPFGKLLLANYRGLVGHPTRNFGGLFVWKIVIGQSRELLGRPAHSFWSSTVSKLVPGQWNELFGRRTQKFWGAAVRKIVPDQWRELFERPIVPAIEVHPFGKLFLAKKRSLFDVQLSHKIWGLTVREKCSWPS